jgi:HPt (histidine-containing phosphotransfer) domain-containing protein
MTDLSPEGRTLQQKLLQRYLDSLPGKRTDLAVAMNDVEKEDFSPETLSRLTKLAHRLAGSAGSYGLDEVGAMALALERAIPGSADDRRQRDAIRFCLKDLQDALQEAQKKT